MTREKMMKKYADLLIRLGVALQKGETLLLEVEAENYEFSRVLTETALHCGAKDVIVHYRDPYVDKYRAQYGDRAAVREVREWMKQSLSDYLLEGACSLKLASPRPELYADADSSVASTVQGFTNELRNVIRRSWGENGTRWCIACIPNPDWAATLYPELPSQEALEQLWSTLMNLCMVREDNDPVEDWINYQDHARVNSDWLNELKPDTIHFTNSLGTDLVIGFNPKAYWVGGEAKATRAPDANMANLPSNEVASSPDCTRIDGTVYSTRPLVYGGKIIRDFALTFRGGRVVEYHAKEGEDLLGILLDTDDGSRSLGEVAFVECDVPIAKTGKIFYNTLLDENASCHLALGNGYALCIPGISWTDPAEWKQEHLNTSCQHIDFMFGTEDMRAVVRTKDGREVEVFRDGKFVKR